MVSPYSPHNQFLAIKIFRSYIPITMTDMELENAATIDENTAVDAAVEKKPAAKGRKTKKVKEVKEKKSVAAAPKKKSVSSHPTYEEV